VWLVPTAHPKVLVTMDMALVEAVDLAARAEGVSRSEWLREAARLRLGGAAPVRPIGRRVVSARVFSAPVGGVAHELAVEPFEEGA
jgi:metal-responsive CopG/Arc/MetJ family transcriptional regulator